MRYAMVLLLLLAMPVLASPVTVGRVQEAVADSSFTANHGAQYIMYVAGVRDGWMQYMFEKADEAQERARLCYNAHSGDRMYYMLLSAEDKYLEWRVPVYIWFLLKTCCDEETP